MNRYRTAVLIAGLALAVPSPAIAGHGGFAKASSAGRELWVEGRASGAGGRALRRAGAGIGSLSGLLLTSRHDDRVQLTPRSARGGGRVDVALRFERGGAEVWSAEHVDVNRSSHHELQGCGHHDQSADNETGSPHPSLYRRILYTGNLAFLTERRVADFPLTGREGLWRDATRVDCMDGERAQRLVDAARAKDRT